MRINTQRSGVTLVEFLVVAVLAAVVLGSIYQALIVQEQSYAAASEMIGDQEAARTALGILEAELREVGSIGGEDIGGSDIAVASADSIVFRAQRKLGIVCKLSRGDNWLLVWPMGETFADNNNLLVFVDGDTLQSADDRWDTSYVSNVSSASDTDCETQWSGMPQQLLQVPDGGDYAVLDSVHTGSAVRGYEWVTYSLRSYSSLGYGLSRRTAGDDTPDMLVSGLAGPGEGLVFEYFDTTGTATTDPTQVARIRITVKTDPLAKTNVEPTELSANLHLRNN